jgi:hypothetical protein
VEAHPYSVLRVFQPDIQYVVPIFQRRYVWNEEDQWADLWEDLLATMGLVAEAEALRESGADVPLPSHFMGAIVVDESLSTGSEVDRRPLVDGQQRLTTLQILLNVTHRVARNRGAERAESLLARLVTNDPALIDEPDDRFKVWPSDPDRAAFRQTMTASSTTDEADEADARLLLLADQFFSGRIEQWVDDQDDSDGSLERLAKTLRRDVEVVVIDLEPGDNAQVIFESLNYGGRELLAIDLVKNHVFFQADRESIEPRQLYAEHWGPFDRDRWREVVSQGRYQRPRAEIFLMHWLKLEHLKEIAAHRLFVEFRNLPAFRDDLLATVARLAGDRDLYERTEVDADLLPVDAGGFFARLELLNQGTPRPVVLQLLRAVPDDLTEERAAKALAILDSYLMRRAIQNRTTANYNRVMLEALRAIDGDLAAADEVLAEHLSNLSGPAVVWPTDDDLRSQLASNAIYGPGRVPSGRIATVLRLIENAWRSDRSEAPIPDDAELQVEHILPQEWGETWPVPGEPAETLELRQEQRQSAVDRLGNLTIVSVPMNPSLSNRPWSEKREILREHSTALVTRRYLDGHHAAEWDEQSISDRGESLIDTIIELWPGPGGQPRDRPIDA